MLDLLFSGRRLIFESPLSVAEATARLEHAIAAPLPVWQRTNTDGHQPLVGTFANARFHVLRRVGGRNSIRPWIDGALSATSGGCRVDVRLKMSTPGIVAFVPFVVIGIAMMAFAASVPLLILPGMAMMVAPIAISAVEARKATQLLADLFNTKPTPGAT